MTFIKFVHNIFLQVGIFIHEMIYPFLSFYQQTTGHHISELFVTNAILLMIGAIAGYFMVKTTSFLLKMFLAVFVFFLAFQVLLGGAWA